MIIFSRKFVNFSTTNPREGFFYKLLHLLGLNHMFEHYVVKSKVLNAPELSNGLTIVYHNAGLKVQSISIVKIRFVKYETPP